MQLAELGRTTKAREESFSVTNFILVFTTNKKKQPPFA
jgi:hypothetical protein